MINKENTENSQKTERRTVIKQLVIFLLICLPITWILNLLGDTMLFAFIPAIAAALTCLITKVKLRELKMFPKFKGHIKIYLFAILCGVFLSVFGNLLLPVCFPKVAVFGEEASLVVVVLSIFLFTAIGTVQFFILMGEEIGWMGFLFPRMEKLCGTTLALVLTGLIRTAWHLALLVQMEDFLLNFATLLLSNILLGAILVWVTKASDSVIPASVIHVLTNAVPSAVLGFMVIDETLYQANYWGIYFVTLIPNVIVAGVCYWMLVKKKY
ncbi:MAG: CPBP family intramembrane metalloprotease [Lachnospiraceae bacterium]|nr:CPBP family intramembrane metalloprotease [Lachnospiraceae bacterium]